MERSGAGGRRMRARSSDKDRSSQDAGLRALAGQPKDSLPGPGWDAGFLV